MKEEGNTKRKTPYILLGFAVLLLLVVIVLTTPLKDWFFAPRTAPTIELTIVEEEIDEEAGLYGYLVEAIVTGRPTPEVLFNRNEGIEEVERNHALIFLTEGESFLLQATASNTLGSAGASLELTGGMVVTKGFDVSQGIIEGHIVYPSAGVPLDLQVVAENLSTGQKFSPGSIISHTKYPTGFGFVIQVPPGDYHIYAFNPGDDYRAYYDEYVQSNYTVDSHEKIIVTITAGMHVDDVVVGNWWMAPSEPANRPPAISGIDFSADELLTGSSYTATARASDPDGDPLSYSWQLTGGGFLIAESTTNPMSFTAPAEEGDYQFRVVVRDGRGGEAEYSETVPVILALPVELTYSTYPVSSETGHIVKDYEARPSAIVYAGDDTSNRICRGFISFDIEPLDGARIGDVELRLRNPNVTGDPSFFHGDMGLWVGVVSWGVRPFQLPDYGLTGIGIKAYTDYDITLCSFSDEDGQKLADELQKAVDDSKDRFQIRLHFAREISNDNNASEGVWYVHRDIILSVWYFQ